MKMLLQNEIKIIYSIVQKAQKYRISRISFDSTNTVRVFYSGVVYPIKKFPYRFRPEMAFLTLWIELF